MPDFAQLLSKPVGDIKRPEAIPAGTWFGLLASFEYDESSQKKTPLCRYFIGNVDPGPDISPDMLEGVDLSKKRLRYEFYLTEAAEFMIKEFLIGLGIPDGGGTRSLGEMIPEAIGKPVMMAVTKVQSDRDPSLFYNNVAEISARSE